MFEFRLSRWLMGLGVAIGLGTAVVWALDVHVNLPDWMLRVVMIKLAFIACGGLLAAGALVGRYARTRQLTEDTTPERLGEGSAQVLEQRQGARSPVARTSDTPS